jgi:antibiotic biosynthesis monooxygenase (ABM) superfamily enzyme
MTKTQPKKWKLMLLTWLFIYPLINILFFLLFPLMKEWHQLLKTLTLTLILVPLMGAFLPKWHGLFKNWLQK